MAGNQSRNKGQNGEREIVRLLCPIVHEIYKKYTTLEIPNLERNQNQSNKGGYDIVGLNWLALEVKRQETENLTAWWQQTKKQAKANQTPVLIYRRNNQPWRAIIEVQVHRDFFCPAQISLADFLKWFKLRLTAELTSNIPQPI